MSNSTVSVIILIHSHHHQENRLTTIVDTMIRIINYPKTNIVLCIYLILRNTKILYLNYMIYLNMYS